MNMKLTNETVTSSTGETLYRIKAIKDIPARGVKKGDKGGFISSLRVNGSARISGNAWVFGEAQVFGNARVFGEAHVASEAHVYGNARVFGQGQVFGSAHVYGEAQVFGQARMYGSAHVYGEAQVFGEALVFGNAKVFGEAQVFGNAWVSGPIRIDDINGVVVIVTAFKYSVTVTRNHVQIGCRLFTRAEILKITRKQAAVLGIPPELYNGYKQMIKGAMLLMKAKA